MDSKDQKISLFAETYREIAATPNPIAAKILPSITNDLSCIHTLWTSQDFVKVERNTFVRDYMINTENLQVLSTGLISDCSSVLLKAFTKSGKRHAILKEQKSPEEKMFLEIWNESRKETTFDLTDAKEHGKVNVNEHFKCLEWSSDEKFLLYTAEQKQPKSVSFFKDSTGKKEENGSKKEENATIIKGEEYVYREEWGEVCVGIHHSVLCILEVKTGLVEVVPTEKTGFDVSVSNATWGCNDDSIIFVGWKESPFRLGIWACRNRRSEIYMFHLKSKEIECLTNGDDITVTSIRFSPNLDSFVYLEFKADGPHFKGSKLQKCDLKTKKISTIVDLVKSAGDNGFNGIYADFLPKRCWSEDGKHVYLTTIWRSYSAIVSVNIDTRHVQRIKVGQEFGDASILDVKNNLIVARFSAPNVEPCLAIGALNKENSDVVEWKFLDGTAPLFHSDIKWSVIKLIPEVVNKAYPNLDYEIILITPTEKKEKCPLIVAPHGGPHSCYVAGFPMRSLGFVKLGYMVCFVNYRGSVGFGENSVHSLPGNIGVQDCADTQQAAVYVKEQCGYDIGDIFVLGGSHGGFLGAHLIGQHPNFYKASALLNPVIDISGMVIVTDVPDWCLVEGGCGNKYEGPVTPDQMKPMWEASPIKYIANVTTPTLLLLGSKDLRVPISQGLKYYQLLKARNVPVRAYRYEDNHQLLKTAHDGDQFMQTILWFQKHSTPIGN